MHQSGTNGLPKQLEEALVTAKEWYDEREQLEADIEQHGRDDEHNQVDRDLSDASGARILEDIVEAIAETWGFAQPLKNPIV